MKKSEGTFFQFFSVDEYMLKKCLYWLENISADLNSVRSVMSSTGAVTSWSTEKWYLRPNVYLSRRSNWNNHYNWNQLTWPPIIARMEFNRTFKNQFQLLKLLFTDQSLYHSFLQFFIMCGNNTIPSVINVTDDHIILHEIQQKTMSDHFSCGDTIFKMILFYSKTWRENNMKNCFRCKFIQCFRDIYIEAKRSAAKQKVCGLDNDSQNT